MRIVKPDAKVITGQDDGGEYGRAYSILDTIEIRLDYFREWYYRKYKSTEGGSINYKDVPALIQEWLASLEAK